MKKRATYICAALLTAILLMGLGFFAGKYLEIRIKTSDIPPAEISAPQKDQEAPPTSMPTGGAPKNKSEETQSDAATSAQQEKSKEDQLYEELLNGFIKDLSAKSMAYRKSRRMLAEVTSSHNYETPEYAKETYKMFVETIAPKLRKMSSDVIETFDIYDKKAKTSLASLSEKDRTIFTKQWQDMLRTQMDVYVRFFENEEKIIQEYHDLVKFYFSKRMDFRIDEQTGDFIFQNEEDRLEEQALKDRIEALERKKPEKTSPSP